MENLILYVIIALIFILFIAWQIKKQGIRKYVVEMIVYAEKTYRDNEIKFESVVDSLIAKLPFPFNLIPTKIIEDLVQKIFNEIKIALDYQKEEN